MGVWRRRSIRRSGAICASNAAVAARSASSLKNCTRPTRRAVRACPGTGAGRGGRARARAGRSPAGRRSISCHRPRGPTGHNAMHVRMAHQRLPPDVQHHGGADLGAEVSRVGGDRLERLGGGLEQQGIDDRLVLEGDGRDRRRQGEDDVEMLDRQPVGGPHIEPRACRAARCTSPGGHRPTVWRSRRARTRRAPRR